MDQEKANVLFVDDDEVLLRRITSSLARRSSVLFYHSARTTAEAVSLAEELRPEVVVVDLQIDPGQGPESGLNLIRQLFELNDCVRILVLTGNSDNEWGVRSISAGAASFLTKPVSIDHLLALIEDGVHVSRLMRAHKEAETDTHAAIAALGLRTRSETMKRVLDEVAFAAATPQPVLLCGETGVGKGVIAHAIHRGGARREGPFIRMQPSFGSHDLIASELFGHVKGAFTGANDNRTGLIKEANSGTLFLDEVDALPQQTQVALLHVLQEKEFQPVGSSKSYSSDFRLIAATNTPFARLTGESKLRMDFYHRIAHTVIHIPALRERRADISDLAREFVTKLSNEEEESTVYGLTNEATTWLSAQPWPGNVRELLATVERGYAQAKFYGRRLVRVSDVQTPPIPKTSSPTTSLSTALRDYELALATSSFTKNHHNYSATARDLGIDRKRLKRILSRAECSL